MTDYLLREGNVGDLPSVHGVRVVNADSLAEIGDPGYGTRSPDSLTMEPPMDTEAPNVYADSMQVGIGPFGITLAFGMQPAGQVGTVVPTRVVNVRMSLEHAKVMVILLKKQLKNFEEQMGAEIPLHPQLHTQLGISRTEDW